MGNQVKYNLKNVHYAKNNGDGTFGTATSVPGAVNINLDPQSESYTFYADGDEYYELEFNNGYEGDLEMALIPDGFRTSMLGEVVDNNGNLVELDGTEKDHFALGFQIDGDKKERLYWYYDCTASRIAETSKTKEGTIEVQTEKMTIRIKPEKHLTYGGKHPVRIRNTDANTTSTVGSWFSAVVTPAITTG